MGKGRLHIVAASLTLKSFIRKNLIWEKLVTKDLLTRRFPSLSSNIARFLSGRLCASTRFPYALRWRHDNRCVFGTLKISRIVSIEDEVEGSPEDTMEHARSLYLVIIYSTQRYCADAERNDPLATYELHSRSIKVGTLGQEVSSTQALALFGETSSQAAECT